MPAGRPKTINVKELIERVKKYIENYEPWYECPVEKQRKDGTVETRMERIANPIPSKQRLAKDIKISRSYLYRLMGENKQLKDTIEKGIEDLYPWVLKENGLSGAYNTAFAIFAAKNELGWADKHEVKEEVEITHRVVEVPALRTESLKSGNGNGKTQNNRLETASRPSN